QLVYSPQGGRLGFMSGQTFQTGRVPLVAGAWARYLASGLALYRHPDWLGSVRLSSTPTQGPPYYDGAYAPYGESYAEWGTTDHQFTGQKEDTVGDLYDFPFREYHSTQGRWLRPDPAGLAAVDPTNPQSLNRYSYVLNNPTGLVDPLGLGCQPGTANCKQPPECLGMVCADQYYGGEMFKGFTTFEMPICVIYGVMGYCDQGALASFMSPTGSDEFDLNAPPIQVGTDENGDPIYVYPGAGLYWAAEPGSAVIDSSGRTSTSTGTLGFSDQIWTWANNPVDFPDLNKLIQGPPLDFTNFDAIMKWASAFLQLSDITSGNYSYFVNYTATSQSPNPVPFGLEWVPFPWLGPGAWFQQWVPLQGFGQ